MPALETPCLVMHNIKENILKVKSGSPGLNTLKSAGMAIKSEKSGINSHVRFKKKIILIEEAKAKNRQRTYRLEIKIILLEKSTAKSNVSIIISLTLGSLACKNPFLEAYSSEKSDSFRKDKALIIAFSIK